MQCFSSRCCCCWCCCFCCCWCCCWCCYSCSLLRYLRCYWYRCCPDTSGFFLEAVDVRLVVVSALVFVFIVLFDVFGALLNAAGFAVGGVGGVSADGAGVLVDAIGRFMEVFTAVLSLPHQDLLILLSLVFYFFFQSKINYPYSKDSHLVNHLMLSMHGLGLYM